LPIKTGTIRDGEGISGCKTGCVGLKKREISTMAHFTNLTQKSSRKTKLEILFYLALISLKSVSTSSLARKTLYFRGTGNFVSNFIKTAHAETSKNLASRIDMIELCTEKTSACGMKAPNGTIDT
jgi:hypothetical protein